MATGLCLWLVAAAWAAAQRVGDAPARRVVDAPFAAVKDVRFDLPVTNGLALHLDADILDDLEDGDPVPRWDDRSGRAHHMTAVGTLTFKADGVNGRSAVYLGQNSGDYLRNASGIAFPAGTDITMALVFRPLGWYGANPGLWRSGNTSAGTEFNIFQGTTGRPWIRWNGVNILRPGSGYQMPLHQDIVTTWIVASGASAEFYADGELKHDVTHTASAPAFTIYNLGWQFTLTERVEGYYSEILIYDRSLDATERQAVEQYLGKKWLDW